MSPSYEEMQFELLKSFILKSIIRTNTEILSPYATSPIDQVEKKLKARKYRKYKSEITGWCLWAYDQWDSMIANLV